MERSLDGQTPYECLLTSRPDIRRLQWKAPNTWLRRTKQLSSESSGAAAGHAEFSGNEYGQLAHMSGLPSPDREELRLLYHITTSDLGVRSRGSRWGRR